jgi:hypothetical protein
MGGASIGALPVLVGGAPGRLALWAPGSAAPALPTRPPLPLDLGAEATAVPSAAEGPRRAASDTGVSPASLSPTIVPAGVPAPSARALLCVDPTRLSSRNSFWHTEKGEDPTRP